MLSQKVEHVARILTKVAAGRDGQDWRQLWLDRITKIVGIGWQKALLRGIPIEVTTSMLLGTNRCMFDPPLYELKEKYFG